MVLVRRSSSICSNRNNDSLPLSSSPPPSSYFSHNQASKRWGKKINGISSQSRKNNFPPACFIATLLLAAGFRFKYTSLQNQILSLSNESVMLQKELSQETMMKDFVMEKWDKFGKQFAAEKEILKKDLAKEKEEVESREENLRLKMDFLHERMQRESHREIRERFGLGPHKVKLEVVLPRHKETMTTSNITIELASIDHMPHAVHLFLEQVHHKLWDNTAFTLNDIHVLQTDQTDPQFADLFEGYELDSLGFQEYSHLYPHEKYTLGYTGRPAGPFFYVNKLNNTKWHGPGGQEFKYIEEEADPCFGKVVKGYDVMDEIFSLEAEDAVLKEPVWIKSATWWDEGRKEEQVEEE